MNFDLVHKNGSNSVIFGPIHLISFANWYWQAVLSVGWENLERNPWFVPYLGLSSKEFKVYVEQRLSIIAQIDLLSSAFTFFTLRSSNRLTRRPSLHFSPSGTSFLGRAIFILCLEYIYGWSNEVKLVIYLKLLYDGDLGSFSTILDIARISELEELTSFQ